MNEIQHPLIPRGYAVDRNRTGLTWNREHVGYSGRDRTWIVGQLHDCPLLALHTQKQEVSS